MVVAAGPHDRGAVAARSWRKSVVMAAAAAVFSAVWARAGPAYAAASVLLMLPVLLKMEEDWEPVTAEPKALPRQEKAAADAAQVVAEAAAADAARRAQATAASTSMGTVYFGTQRGQSKRFAEALVTSAAQAGLHLKLADMR